MKFKSEIIIQHQVEGLHCWRNAPNEVAFLRNPHRHVFHIKVGMPVGHNDRQREFFMELTALKHLLATYDFHDAGSCEMIGEFILQNTPQATWAEVFEDGENGARVSRESQSPQTP